MLQIMPANTSVSTARNFWLLSGLSTPTRLTAIFDLPGRQRMSPEETYNTIADVARIPRFRGAAQAALSHGGHTTLTRRRRLGQRTRPHECAPPSSGSRSNVAASDARASPFFRTAGAH